MKFFRFFFLHFFSHFVDVNLWTFCSVSVHWTVILFFCVVNWQLFNFSHFLRKCSEGGNRKKKNRAKIIPESQLKSKKWIFNWMRKFDPIIFHLQLTLNKTVLKYQMKLWPRWKKTKNLNKKRKKNFFSHMLNVLVTFNFIVSHPFHSTSMVYCTVCTEHWCT